jgi:hypothetical protein
MHAEHGQEIEGVSLRAIKSSQGQPRPAANRKRTDMAPP